MRHYPSLNPAVGRPLLVGFLILITLLLISGCGGSGNSTTKIPDVVKVTTNPTTLSLNKGEIGQVTGSALDKSDAPVLSAKITYTSSDPTVATVSTTGAVCAGQWDATFINCDTTNFKVGTTNIIATSGSISSTAVVVNTHLRIDNVIVTPPADCVSQGQTLTLTARAFNQGVDITSTVGTFAFRSSNAGVVTLADTNATPNTIVVTSKNPGQTNIFANIDGINSIPVVFTSCAVKSIALHVTGVADTAFTFASGENKTLAADVTDTKDQPVTGLLLTLSSSAPATASVVTGTATPNATAINPGVTGIVASCTPPACNIGLYPIYSNVVTATVTGTIPNTTVYVGSTSSLSLVPVDTGTSIASSAITLPALPNSLQSNPLGTKLYLGSDGGLLVVDIASGTPSVLNTAATGKVLAISADSKKIVVSDTTAGKVFVVDQAGTLESFAAPGVIAAAFTPDAFKAYLASAANTYVYSPGFSLRTLAGGGTDAAFAAGGTLGYVAAGTLTVRASCNDAVVGTATGSGILRPLNNGNLLAANTAVVTSLAVSTTPGTTGCPPTASNTATAIPFTVPGTPKQMIALPDGSRAFVLVDPPNTQLVSVNVATGVATPLTLATGGTALVEGLTASGNLLFVGAGVTQNLHRIDVATNSDGEIAVGLKKADGSAADPNLLAVRPK